MYRTIQELATTARKHARAERLDVTVVEKDDVLNSTVTDDRIGFDVDQARDRTFMRHHLGLESAIERVHLAGGSIDLVSKSGVGTAVRFSIPLPPSQP